jgi:hypothetical protein
MVSFRQCRGDKCNGSKLAKIALISGVSSTVAVTIRLITDGLEVDVGTAIIFAFHAVFQLANLASVLTVV